MTVILLDDNNKRIEGMDTRLHPHEIFEKVPSSRLIEIDVNDVKIVITQGYRVALILRNGIHCYRSFPILDTIDTTASLLNMIEAGEHIYPTRDLDWDDIYIVLRQGIRLNVTSHYGYVEASPTTPEDKMKWDMML